MYVERYLPYIGAAGPIERQTIEAGAIRRFAEAIGDNDPIYYDEEYAKNTIYGRIIAPPTFSFTLRYPPIPGVWLAPVGRIHAMQEFQFYKPIRAGDVVCCRKRLTDAYEKERKGGVMVFLVQEMGAYDEDMKPYSISLMTTITRGVVFENVDKLASAAAPEKEISIEGSFDALCEGLSLSPVTLPAVTRVDIARYAGASGDYNAIHIDDEAAKKVGFPSAIAHGMITAALQGRVAKAWLGGLCEFQAMKIRFSNPVFPGDVLTFSGSVKAVHPEAGTVELEYAVSNQSGCVIISGALTARRLGRLLLEDKQ